MIVQPDFFSHWKTRCLVALSGDPAAPLWVLRLWAYCQTKRSGHLDLSDAALLGVCEAPGSTPIRRFLTEARFIVPGEGTTFTVHEWEEHQSGLLQRWQAGRLGGRPQKNNRPVTDRLPAGYRPVSISPQTGDSDADYDYADAPYSAQMFTEITGKPGDSPYEKNRSVTGRPPDKSRVEKSTTHFVRSGTEANASVVVCPSQTTGEGPVSGDFADEAAPIGRSKAGPPCPFVELVQLYHDTCISLRPIRKDTDSRRQAVLHRWRQFKADREVFRLVFAKAEASDFLTGRARRTRPGERVWTADFDWLMKQGNFVKVLEGGFDNDR